MRYLSILLLVVSLSFGFVMDGTSRYNDCLYFDNLISLVLGSNQNYMTIVGSENGTSTYNVFAPNDYWDGSTAGWGVLHICFLAAGYTSQQSSYTSDKCNVIFADRMYTMTTSNCRTLTGMEGSDAYLYGWVRDHCIYDTMGCDDLMGM